MIEELLFCSDDCFNKCHFELESIRALDLNFNPNQ